MSTAKFDRIEVVLDFWDLPREGLTSVGGKPHYFIAEFDEERDEYAPTYLLIRIDDASADRLRSAWDEWLAWRRAFDRGDALREAGDERASELRDIAASLTTLDQHRALAKFHPIDLPDLPREFAYVVEWQVVQ